MNITGCSRKIPRRLAFLLSVALVATACASGDEGTGEAEAASEPDHVTATAVAVNTEPIKVATALDLTGNLAGYGLPMMAATELAIKEINEAGGVLGRPLDLVVEDAQSDLARYTTLAQEFAADPEIAVVQGGILSASKEAMRPIFREAEKLYFYHPLYEGGVCDKNTFIMGETASQQLRPILEWAVENGLKKWYVVAANYNYGQISVDWAQQYAEELGAEIVGGPTFFDLTVDNFSDQIPKIQRSGADTVVSFLVGGAHNNFYKQWASAGLNETTTIVSTSFGYGAEQVVLGPDAEGIVAAFNYFEEVDTPENAAFVEAYRAAGNEGYMTEGVIGSYAGWHLWAAAANAAGSVEREDVIAELETGTSFEGPAGTISIDPTTHHVVVPLLIGRATGEGGWEVIDDSVTEAVPSFERSKCDLIANPETNEVFTP